MIVVIYLLSAVNKFDVKALEVTLLNCDNYLDFCILLTKNNLISKCIIPAYHKLMIINLQLQTSHHPDGATSSLLK